MSLIIGFIVFLSVIFFFLAIQSFKKQKRLALMRSVTSYVEEKKKPLSIPIIDKMYQEIRETGLNIKRHEFVILFAIVILSGFVAFSFMFNDSYGIAGMITTTLIFKAWIKGKIKKRKAVLRDQFALFIMRISNTMKSHLSLEESLRIVTEKTEEPLRKEMMRMIHVYHAENNIIKALKSVTDFIPLDEYRLFVMGAEINKEIGGNFSKLLEKMVSTVEAKKEIAKKMYAYSSHGRSSAKLIGSLAVGSFFYFRIFVPDFIEPLTSTTIGMFILFYSVISILFGWHMIKKMSDVSID